MEPKNKLVSTSNFGQSTCIPHVFSFCSFSLWELLTFIIKSHQCLSLSIMAPMAHGTLPRWTPHTTEQCPTSFRRSRDAPAQCWELGINDTTGDAGERCRRGKYNSCFLGRWFSWENSCKIYIYMYRIDTSCMFWLILWCRNLCFGWWHVANHSPRYSTKEMIQFDEPLSTGMKSRPTFECEEKNVEAATVSHAIFRVVCMSFVFECVCSGAFYWNLLLPYFLTHSIRYVWATERCFMEYGELGFECMYSDLLLTTAFNPRLQDANALPKDGEVQDLLASTDAKWVECIDGRQLKWGEHLGFWIIAPIEGMCLFLSSFHCTWHSQHS